MSIPEAVVEAESFHLKLKEIILKGELTYPSKNGCTFALIEIANHFLRDMINGVLI